MIGAYRCENQKKNQKKKEKKRTNKLKKKDRSKRKSINENYIMYNVYILYTCTESGMNIKKKEEKKEQETAPHTYRTRI